MIQVRLRPCLRHQRSRHCSYRHRSDVTVNQSHGQCLSWLDDARGPLRNGYVFFMTFTSKHVVETPILESNKWYLHIFYIYFSHSMLHIFTCIYIVCLHIYVNVISGMILFWDTPKSNSKSSFRDDFRDPIPSVSPSTIHYPLVN